MSEITWQNVSGSGGDASSTVRSNALGTDVILNAFAPLEKIMADRVATQNKNWDNEAKQNTQQMQAQIRQAQSIGEFNKNRAAGAYSEDVFNKQYGMQYDPSKIAETEAAQQNLLQEKFKNRYYGEATAVSDQKFDNTAGALYLQKKAIEEGVDAGFAARLGSDFIKETKVNEDFYNKVKKENLIPLLSNVNFDVHSTADDVTDKLNEWKNQGLPIDFDFARDALEKKRISARTDWDQERQVAEYNYSVDQREKEKSVTADAIDLYGSTSGDLSQVVKLISKSGLENSSKLITSLLPSLAQMTALNPVDQLQIEANNAAEEQKLNTAMAAQNAWLTTEQKQIDKGAGFNTERLKFLSEAAEKGEDVIGSFDTENSDISKEDINNGMDLLTSDKIGLGQKEAAVVLSLTLSQIKGDGQNDYWPDMLDRDVEHAFEKLLTKNALAISKYNKENDALTEVRNQLNSENTAWGSANKTLADARRIAASQSKLTGEQVSTEDLLKNLGIPLPTNGEDFDEFTNPSVLKYKQGILDTAGVKYNSKPKINYEQRPNETNDEFIERMNQVHKDSVNGEAEKALKDKVNSTPYKKRHEAGYWKGEQDIFLGGALNKKDPNVSRSNRGYWNKK